MLPHKTAASALSESGRQGAATTGSPQAAPGREIDRSVQLSCGEHTDYGLLTLVNQDPDIPALQVEHRSPCTVITRVHAKHTSSEHERGKQDIESGGSWGHISGAQLGISARPVQSYACSSALSNSRAEPSCCWDQVVKCALVWSLLWEGYAVPPNAARRANGLTLIVMRR